MPKGPGTYGSKKGRPPKKKKKIKKMMGGGMIISFSYVTFD